MDLIRSRMLSVLIAGVLAALVVGSVGSGTIQSSETGAFAPCTSTRSCTRGETLIASPRGAPGPRGARGPRGATGPRGAQGATGPQGLRGATGAKGATGVRGETGPAGDTGPAGVTDVNVVTGDVTLSNDTDELFSAGAACADGETLLSGGYTITGGSPSDTDVIENYPSDNEWDVTVQTSNADVEVQAYAVCATVAS